MEVADQSIAIVRVPPEYCFSHFDKLLDCKEEQVKELLALLTLEMCCMINMLAKFKNLSRPFSFDVSAVLLFSTFCEHPSIHNCLAGGLR